VISSLDTFEKMLIQRELTESFSNCC